MSLPGEDIEENHVYGNAAVIAVDGLKATSENNGEQHVYGNVPALTVDKVEAPSGCKCCFVSLAMICCLIVTGIILLHLYLISEGNIIIRPEQNNLTQAKSDLEDGNTNLKAEWVKFNATRAQWSINAYCPKGDSGRTCKPCEKGWIHSLSSCYAVNDYQPAGQRSWTGARKDCRGKGSDLVVVADDDEKKYINDNSWESSGSNGYWIGLRAEGGKWKWVDGSDLAETSWMTDPATDGQCVISVQHGRWKSVSCDGNQRWICGKGALSV